MRLIDEALRRMQVTELCEFISTFPIYEWAARWRRVVVPTLVVGVTLGLTVFCGWMLRGESPLTLAKGPAALAPPSLATPPTPALVLPPTGMLHVPAPAESLPTPMSPVLEPVPADVSAKLEPVPIVPTLNPRLFRLTGIVTSPGQPLAIVNGRVVTVGDVVQEARVAAIAPRYVLLEQGATRITLTLWD